MIIPNELIFAVDEQDNPLPPISRSQAHQEGVWHRISHVWIINNQKQILCQQRSLSKDTNPGKWEAFFGGHAGAGETYEESALKETAEETGLLFSPSDLHFFTKAKKSASHTAKHFQAAFYVIWNGSVDQLHIEKEEVEQVVWKNVAELEDILLVQQDPGWVHVLYEKDMLNLLKNL